MVAIGWSGGHGDATLGRERRESARFGGARFPGVHICARVLPADVRRSIATLNIMSMHGIWSHTSPPSATRAPVRGKEPIHGLVRKVVRPHVGTPMYAAWGPGGRLRGQAQPSLASGGGHDASCPDPERSAPVSAGCSRALEVRARTMGRGSTGMAPICARTHNVGVTRVLRAAATVAGTVVQHRKCAVPAREPRETRRQSWPGTVPGAYYYTGTRSRDGHVPIGPLCRAPRRQGHNAVSGWQRAVLFTVTRKHALRRHCTNSWCRSSSASKRLRAGGRGVPRSVQRWGQSTSPDQLFMVPIASPSPCHGLLAGVHFPPGIFSRRQAGEGRGGSSSWHPVPAIPKNPPSQKGRRMENNSRTPRQVQHWRRPLFLELRDLPHQRSKVPPGAGHYDAGVHPNHHPAPLQRSANLGGQSDQQEADGRRRLLLSRGPAPRAPARGAVDTYAVQDGVGRQ